MRSRSRTLRSLLLPPALPPTCLPRSTPTSSLPASQHNPPAALPNGYVYSQRALAAMAAANGGRITCPRTGFTCDASELRRVYIS